MADKKKILFWPDVYKEQVLMSRVLILIILLAMFFTSCGDDGSGVNSFERTPETSLLVDDANSSSSVDVLPSSAMVDESSSSENLDESSSSAESSSSEKKELLSSSAEKEKSSSSEVLDESSSSMKNENSSNSVKTEESSSAEIFDESSSSVKNESSSSSVKTEISSSSEVSEKSSSSITLSSSSETPTVKSIYDAENNTLTDLRDNKVYKTVTIGEQIWMAENLNYMPEDTAGTIYSGGTVCGGGSLKSSEDSKKCSIYGRLYTKKIALYKATKSNRQGVCPEGWSIPLKSDWEKLVSFLGDHAAAKLKKADGSWSSTSTNESGFSALIAGTYNYSLKYYTSDSTTAFYHWENKTNPYFFRLYDKSDDASAINYAHGIDMMYSVRCIKE